MGLYFSPVLGAFGLLDWFVLGGYLATMLAIGVSAAWRESRQKSGTEEFFLGGRSMPTWALAISIVGSSLSAATFIGAPDYSYGGNLSYLILNVGGLIAVFVVGFLFVPRLYNAGTVTIYGYLAQRFGEPARMGASVAFLLGRMLASGSRLMMVAVPLSMMIYGVQNTDDITKRQMVVAILAVGLVGTFYTVFGGIKTVIWVDVIQFVLVMGAALLTIGLLLHKIPVSAGDIVGVLQDPNNTPDGTSKLKLLDLSADPRKPFTLWAALTGAVLLNVAAFGVDHDLAQRFPAAQLAQVANINPRDVQPNQPIVRYGLDSPDAIELALTFEQQLGIPLPPTLFWDYQSLGALAEYVWREHHVTAPSPVTQPPPVG